MAESGKGAPTSRRELLLRFGNLPCEGLIIFAETIEGHLDFFAVFSLQSHLTVLERNEFGLDRELASAVSPGSYDIQVGPKFEGILILRRNSRLHLPLFLVRFRIRPFHQNLPTGPGSLGHHSSRPICSLQMWLNGKSDVFVIRMGIHDLQFDQLSRQPTEFCRAQIFQNLFLFIGRNRFWFSGDPILKSLLLLGSSFLASARNDSSLSSDIRW